MLVIPEIQPTTHYRRLLGFYQPVWAIVLYDHISWSTYFHGDFRLFKTATMPPLNATSPHPREKFVVSETPKLEKVL